MCESRALEASIIFKGELGFPHSKNANPLNQEEDKEEIEMPDRSLSGFIGSPKFGVVIDMGNPFLNKTVDGFLKIGTVAASTVAVEESFNCLKKGSFTKVKAEDALKKMCKEGVYWGTVAGVYVGMEYGMERIRGTRDWKNAMLGGVLTGALISAASNKNKDQIVMDAIRGGAVATAAEFLNYLS